jgi:hypothetical protein
MSSSGTLPPITARYTNSGTACGGARLRGSRDGNGLSNKAKFGFLRRSVVLVGRETSQAITAALLESAKRSKADVVAGPSGAPR